MGVINSINGKIKKTNGKEDIVECAGHYNPLHDSCKDCTPNYDINYFPNNYDCGYFRPYVKEQKIVVNK